MRARRAFGSWQFIAALILPAWVLLGYGIFGGSSGWTTLGLLIAAPILAVALAVVASIVAFRVTVRPTRSPAWPDIAVLGAWHASIIWFGFFPSGAWAIGMLSVVIGIAAFWYAVARFFGDARAALVEFADVSAARASVPNGQYGRVVGDGYDPERPQDGQTLRI
ncbi:MFS transporter [Microbacteriaceae bacterium VKM Ac-2855]|nr:MFS transporter [Microbacteriaceae bacterium VKM Ac-2855]